MTIAFQDLYTQPTKAEIKAGLISLLQAVGLRVTSWIPGDASERWLEAFARGIDAYTSSITVQLVRGFFLDLATDPGDPGNASTLEAPGWLSALGEGWYGTQRRGATVASGFVELTNEGLSNAVFAPEDLTFQRLTSPTDDGRHTTYRNTADDSIYTNTDGTVTLAPGDTITIPVRAEIVGTAGNAQGDEITVVVTQSFGSLSVNNDNPVSGTDRETADAYRIRCRQAAAKASPAGAADAYRYAAMTADDGTPLQRSDGSGTVGITRVQVSTDSATGVVMAYYAAANDTATAEDVLSANANITGIPLGVITSPIGVVPDGITFTGQAATGIDVAVSGFVRIKNHPGLDTDAIKTAILEKLAVHFAAFPIGGLDVDPATDEGTLYKNDLIDVVGDADEKLYNITITSPGANVTLGVGEVALLDSSPSDWTVTVTS